MEADLVSFATDIGNGDPEIIAAVRRWLAEPPNSRDEIGFYCDPDDVPLEWRQFAATVSLLASRGHIMRFEDKYTNEAVSVWVNEGLVDLAAFPQNTRALLNMIADGDVDRTDGSAFHHLWEHYAAVTQAIEAAMLARGKTLISLDPNDGDTMFFAAVDPAVADRWVGTGFAVKDDFGRCYECGVRPPMWDRWWDHLLYALDLDDEALEDDGSEQRGLPPGVRQRAPLNF